MIQSPDIPVKYLDVAEAWHDGQSSMLYAVLSTGSLNRGTHRPMGEDDYLSDDEWLLSLWSSLEIELERIQDIQAKRSDLADDADLVTEFLEFVRETIADMEKNIGN